MYSFVNPPYAVSRVKKFTHSKYILKKLEQSKPNASYMMGLDEKVLNDFSGKLIISIAINGISTFRYPVLAALNSQGISPKDIVTAQKDRLIPLLKNIDMHASEVVKAYFPHAQPISGIVSGHHMEGMSETEKSIQNLLTLGCDCDPILLRKMLISPTF